MLVVTAFSEAAFNFGLNLASTLTLIPFLLVALHTVNQILRRETYVDRPGGLGTDVIIAVLMPTA